MLPVGGLRAAAVRQGEATRGAGTGCSIGGWPAGPGREEGCTAAGGLRGRHAWLGLACMHARGCAWRRLDLGRRRAALTCLGLHRSPDIIIICEVASGARGRLQGAERAAGGEAQAQRAQRGACRGRGASRRRPPRAAGVSRRASEWPAAAHAASQPRVARRAGAQLLQRPHSFIERTSRPTWGVVVLWAVQQPHAKLPVPDRWAGRAGGQQGT